MSTDYFVAIDVGVDGGRAAVAKLEGDRLGIEERHRFACPVARMNGTLHWNLLSLWEDVKAGIRRCTADAGPPGGASSRRIDSVGVDAWGQDFGLVAPSGEILSNPVHFRDRRTDGLMDKVFQRISRQRVYEITGAHPVAGNTLYQLIALQQARSSLLPAAETLLFIPDLFNYLLTGKKQTEFSIATSSQMINPRKRAWADEMLVDLELPKRLLPTLSNSGSVIAPMRKETALECRCAALPVVATASHDVASAVCAVPTDGGDNWCYIHSGASSVVGVELAGPLITEKALRLEFTNEGGGGGRVRFQKSVPGLSLIHECRRFFAQQGNDVAYDELMRLVTQAPVLESVIDPDHTPFRSPGDIPKKIERFCTATGQRPPTSAGGFTRVCLESIALTYRRTLAALDDVLGKRIKTIYIVGAGARNPILNQMTADACGRTVYAGPADATLIGNALIQAMSMGSIRTIEQGRSIVRNSFEIKRFDPRETKLWDAAHARYQEVRQAEEHLLDAADR